MKPGLIIVDDFYPDPDKIRQKALTCEYETNELKRKDVLYPGHNSATYHHDQETMEVISRIIGAPIRWTESVANGYFRITLRHEVADVKVHVDQTNGPGVHWGGVCYLTKPEHCHGGTDFYRNRIHGWEREPSMEDIRKMGYETREEFHKYLMTKEGSDMRNWEKIMSVPMRYNRLILFDSAQWHSPGEAFGTSLEDGRLIQMFFFTT